MNAVFNQSVQSLIEDVQTPQAKGGNMPVDTGFLRNSGHAALNSIPSGESKQPKGYQNTDYDIEAELVVVNNAKLGDRVVFGWTALYAPFMEAKYAFMRLAAQNWDKTVKRNAQKLEQRFKQNAN